MPTTFLGPAPQVTPPSGDRPVTVAVLDSPVAPHPWLPETVVDRAPTVGGIPVGDHGLLGASVVDNALLRQLGSHSGHGTFIAGLIRQACPEAHLVSVPVFGRDGVASEFEVLEALALLVVRQLRARRGLEDREVDVVSMSLGYYHEAPEDADYSIMLASRLRALGMLGIAVVTSAGNDATVRPAFPAALAPHDRVPTERDVVPVVTVGATNPDGTSALFSNDGPWVTTWRVGVGLVSAFPLVDAGQAPDVSAVSPFGMTRAALDPDDYTRGFAIWSGTSFAAPVYAAEVAAALGSAGVKAHEDVGSIVTRTWEIVAATTNLERP